MRQAVPNICFQMLLRGATPSATRRTPPVTNAFVEEAADTGIDIFRIFDALNDVEQMRPAIEAVGTARVAEVALATPATCPAPREAVHARLLPRLAERSSTPGRTCSRSRTWRACCARRLRARSSPRCASGSTCRCTCTPTTPRADSWPPCWPRSTREWTPSTRPRPRWPGRRRSPRSPRWSPRPTTPPRTGLFLAPCARWSRTGKPPAGSTPPSSRARLPDRPRLPPRDPRRPALQPAPAGRRAGSRGEVRADRGHVRRRQRHPRQPREGDALLQGGRRPRTAPRRGRGRPRPVRGEPREVRHPRLRHRLPQRRARRPARRLARAVPREGAQGPHRKQPVAELSEEESGASGAPRRRAPSTSCCSPDPRRPSTSRSRRTATSRCCGPPTTSTA